MRCSRTTAAGQPCRRWAVKGSDPPTCAAHLGLTARAPGLSDELTDRLVLMLRAGNYVGTACKAVRLPRRTFDYWYARGETGESPYAEFRDRIEAAKADGEVRNVTAIATAAPTNWQAAAWLLERMYPERWSRPSQRPDDVKDAQPQPVDPLAEVDELADVRRRRGAV